MVDRRNTIDLCGLPFEAEGFRFTCAEKSDGKTTFPCTGKAHTREINVLCSCPCHTLPAVVSVEMKLEPGVRRALEPKQVIIIRKDLGMRKGKMIAQGAHASLKVFFDRFEFMTDSDPDDPLRNQYLESENLGQAMVDWYSGSFAKIVVSVQSEEELLDIYRQAKAAGIPCALIQDAGRTEFKGVPTYTAVAVGPDYPNRIDPITGKLKLL